MRTKYLANDGFSTSRFHLIKSRIDGSYKQKWWYPWVHTRWYKLYVLLKTSRLEVHFFRSGQLLSQYTENIALALLFLKDTTMVALTMWQEYCWCLILTIFQVHFLIKKTRIQCKCLNHNLGKTLSKSLMFIHMFYFIHCVRRHYLNYKANRKEMYRPCLSSYLASKLSTSCISLSPAPFPSSPIIQTTLKLSMLHFSLLAYLFVSQLPSFLKNGTPLAIGLWIAVDNSLFSVTFPLPAADKGIRYRGNKC